MTNQTISDMMLQATNLKAATAGAALFFFLREVRPSGYYVLAEEPHSVLLLARATLEFVERSRAVQMKSPASITLARLTPWNKNKKGEKNMIHINTNRHI